MDTCEMIDGTIFDHHYLNDWSHHCFEIGWTLVNEWWIADVHTTWGVNVDWYILFTHDRVRGWMTYMMPTRCIASLGRMIGCTYMWCNVMPCAHRLFTARCMTVRRKNNVSNAQSPDMTTSNNQVTHMKSTSALSTWLMPHVPICPWYEWQYNRGLHTSMGWGYIHILSVNHSSSPTEINMAMKVRHNYRTHVSLVSP